MLRQPNGPARPDTFGSRFSSGTTASSSTISPVTEVRSESLPSIFGVEKPLVPRSTMKPRILPSSLAQTTARSAIGALEIHILAPLSLIAAGDLLGARHHRARIGAEVRLGQAEAADQLAVGELGQILLLLRLGAVGVDRMHHQRRLHRHRRAIAGIDALHLARDQAVGDIAEARAAVFLRDGRAEQAERAHLGQELLVDLLLAPGEPHPRHQLVLREAARAVAHHALFLGQIAFEVERVLPVEFGILQDLGGLCEIGLWDAAVDMAGSRIAIAVLAAY